MPDAFLLSKPMLTYAHAVENIVFQRLGATSENLDDGEIFTLRLPSSECDACGLLRAPHSTAQAPIKSFKSMQGRHENENLQASKKS